MKRFLCYFLAAVMLAFSACSSQNVPQVPDEPVPTFEVVSVPSPTTLSHPRPAATPKPSPSPTATPTPTPTPLPEESEAPEDISEQPVSEDTVSDSDDSEQDASGSDASAEDVSDNDTSGSAALENDVSGSDDADNDTSGEPETIQAPETPAAPSQQRPGATPKPPSQSGEDAVPVDTDNSQGGATNGEPMLDVSTASKGYVTAAIKDSQKAQLSIEKDGSTNYFPVTADGKSRSFSLTGGSGTYKVTLLAGVGGNRYIAVASETFNVTLSNANAAWLTSGSDTRWDENMASIQWAKKNLTGSDSDKITTAYKLLVYNYDYDYDIVGKLPNGYMPTIENTYKTKKGICYDFSSLLACMLRSVGVPTKLCIGKSSNVSGLHAWNEVYVDGKWKTIDTSNDACYRMAKVKVPAMYKTKGYTVQKEH